MSTTLLDVNVLVALVLQSHIHHGLAHEWLASQRQRKWATCPLVQNGCIRIMGQLPAPRRVIETLDSLKSLLDHSDHEFWPDSVSLLDDTSFDPGEVQSAKQVTDIYLLGLAVRRGGHLVTFDRSIPWKAVNGAKASDLKILGRPRSR